MARGDRRVKLHLPPAWHRQTFAVHLLADPTHALEPRAALVSGLVAGCFGIYPGTLYHAEPPDTGPRQFTLVHMPSQMAQLTLPRRYLCRKAAEEFAGCDLAWESAWVLGVVGPGLEQAREIHSRWRGWGKR